MALKFTFVYAYRDRDVDRVNLSLLSLEKQERKNFEVQFIDYGSNSKYANLVKDIVGRYSFASYHYIAHEGLLWNKSKAINYGFLKAKTEFVFISDVDILFDSGFTKTLVNVAKLDQFALFKIGYLGRETDSENIKNKTFKLLKPTHYGDTFGVGLFPKSGLKKVKGLDTFFHFYGSEDEDLNQRLIVAGYKLYRYEKPLLLHQWHPRYPQRAKEKLTVTPRLYNIQRINQRHYLWHKYQSVIVPSGNVGWNQVFLKDDFTILENSERTYNLDNVKAKVIHVLDHELLTYEGQVVTIIFEESPYYRTFKYRVKCVLNKQTQPYISMKEINDLILQRIVFKYRHYNYAYKVASNLEKITFSIDLRKPL